MLGNEPIIVALSFFGDDECGDFVAHPVETQIVDLLHLDSDTIVVRDGGIKLWERP